MNVATIDGNTLTSEEFVSWLKLTGRFTHVVQDLIKDRLTAVAAKKSGLAVTDEELQNAADEHRRMHGLHRVTDTNEFLDSAQVSLEQYETFIEDSVLASKMFDEVANDAAVEEYFKLNAPDYDAIEIGHIVVDSEGKANEVYSIVSEDPSAFAELAREVSTAETASDGGRIGRVYRGSMDAELEAKIFSAGVGEAVGPFASGKDYYEIFTVLAKHDAQLDSATKQVIKGNLYAAWLESTARDMRVEA